MSSAVIAIDVTALTVVVFTLVVYHAWLFVRVRKGSPAVTLTFMRMAGPLFVWKHLRLADAASVTLFVQTARNTILTSVFLGGAAFTAGLQALSGLNAEDRLTLTVTELRQVLLAACLFSSFLNWALLIRCCSHLGYLVGAVAGSSFVSQSEMVAARAGTAGSTLGPDTGDIELGELREGISSGGGGGGGGAAVAGRRGRSVTVSVPRNIDLRGHMDVPIEAALAAQAEKLMNLLSLHFSLALRFFYLSIPFVFAAAGPISFLAAALTILLFIWYVDHATS